MAAKTVKDFVDIQSDFARTSLDNVLSESTRLSEMSVKVANEAFDPLKAQFNTGFEKLLRSRRSKATLHYSLARYFGGHRHGPASPPPPPCGAVRLSGDYVRQF